MAIPDDYREHALGVLAELKAIHADMERLMDAIGEKRSFTPEETEQLRADLKALKERLARGAKYGTADGEGRIPTQVESAFFAGAVKKASAFIGINANSRPGQDWFSRLYGVQVDIGHAIAELEAEL